jgi:DNA polymerase bacteriophage-type
MGGGRLLTHIRAANIAGTGGTGTKETEAWVTKWRQQNPKIVAFWAALDATARAAVRNPEMDIACGRVRFQMRDDVLCLHLPSGREVKYPSPSLTPGRFGQQQVTFLNMEAGARRGEQMYGGKWTENVTSAVARDLLVEAMKRLRAAGYQLVMHTHDEIVTEMLNGIGSGDEFKRLLVEAPAWALGLPTPPRFSRLPASRRIKEASAATAAAIFPEITGASSCRASAATAASAASG